MTTESIELTTENLCSESLIIFNKVFDELEVLFKDEQDVDHDTYMNVITQLIDIKEFTKGYWFDDVIIKERKVTLLAD